MVTACVYPVNGGYGDHHQLAPKVMEARKMTLELLLSNHKKDCLSCVRSTNCELQTLCHEYGVDEHRFGGVAHRARDGRILALLSIRDNNKCILCRRCVAACQEHAGHRRHRRERPRL